MQTSGDNVIIVYLVYLPNQGSSEDYATVLNAIAATIHNSEDNALYIICGDFNKDVVHLCGHRLFVEISTKM